MENSVAATPAPETASALVAHLQGDLDSSIAKLDDIARERARLSCTGLMAH